MNIEKICKKYGIENYTINDDGSIDVDGDVWLCDKELIELPLRFNKVTGYFICSNNNLTTLKGSPRWVGSDFLCSGNKLTSLEFSPDCVGGSFSCKNNKLTDNYCDTEIGEIFFTNMEQDGLVCDYDNFIAINYKEWIKLRKRKLVLEKLFN